MPRPARTAAPAAALALLLASAIACGATGSPAPYQPEPPPTPPAVCATALPLADVSAPDRVVGQGTPTSCTEAALRTALAGGGTITFACGAAPVTIRVGAELLVSTARDTVLDGGGLVTLDGQGATRLLALRHSFERTAPRLTVQRLTLARGRSSGDLTAGGGGAIYRLGGSLSVLECTFVDNAGPTAGQDVAGGAVSSIGGGPTLVARSTFARNACSNGGALGNLGNPLTVVNSAFTGNAATGTGGNPGDGGNGGAISVDGQGTEVALCGVTLRGNAANAYGGAFFRVGYTGEPTGFDRCTVDANAIPDRAPSLAGGLYLQGVAATVTASTLSRNAAMGGGGAFIGPGTTLRMVNTTVASNTALSGLGGGLFVSGAGVSGSLRNVTFAGNTAPGSVAFGGAIAGGSTALVLASSVVAGSAAGNTWNPVSCTVALGDGGGNVQWPAVRANGTSDAGSPCAAGVLWSDPLLGGLGLHGGPTETALPAAGSPALERGTACPSADQRGVARAAACTSGAVEASGGG